MITNTGEDLASGPSSQKLSASSPPMYWITHDALPVSTTFPIFSASTSASIPMTSLGSQRITFSSPSQVSSDPDLTSEAIRPIDTINVTRLAISPQRQQRRNNSSLHSSRRRKSNASARIQGDVQVAYLENTLKLPSLGVALSRPNSAAAPKVTLSHRCKPDAKVIFDQSHFKRIGQKETKTGISRINQVATTQNEAKAIAEVHPIQASISASPQRQNVRLPSDDSTNTMTSPNSLRSLLTGGEASAATPTTPDVDSQSVASTSSSLPSSVKKNAWSTPRSWAEMAAARGSNGSHALSVSTQVFSENVGDYDANKRSAVNPTKHKTSPGTSKKQLPNGKSRSNEPMTLEEALKEAESCFSAPLTYPRGMVNRGNMCFANAILQVLVYCAPFYNLFHLVGGYLNHDFHNTTPLMEAVISFLSEFKLLSSALQKSLRETPNLSVDLLRDVRAASEPFVPEYLYEAMKLNKRFDAMRRGHQEDAEEFLGFFLDTLHEELLTVMKDSNDRLTSGKGKEIKDSVLQGVKGGQIDDTSASSLVAPNEREVKRPISPMEGDGWLEVGQKGRTSFTRTTSTAHSPITRIFGGKLRSLLRIPGSKDSVTLEPYQPLQLDIQPPHVTTIEEALVNLTVPETISGVQSSLNRGMVEATKQVFIETLPPILILHLKRFVFDDVGGVQKSSKVLSYGPVLDISENVISPARRSEVKRRYRLFGVVYHHGRQASGGHYTVDVLKQDQTEWLHIDDTTWNSAATPSVRVGNEQMTAKQHHDGVAYLLFYVREDAVLTNGLAISTNSNGQLHSAVNLSNNHAKRDMINNNHQRVTSTSSQKSLNGKR